MKLKKLISITFVALAGLMMSSCASLAIGGLGAIGAMNDRKNIDAEATPILSVLQIRQMQEIDVEDPDVIKILNVSISVLMDDGYTIDSAAPTVGLLRASKVIQESDVDSAGTAFFKAMFGQGGNSTKHTLKKIEAVVNVVSYGEGSRVRVASRLALTSNRGDMSFKPIYELEYYQEFFTKLRKGLFLEQEDL